MSLDRLRRAAESLAGSEEGDYLLQAVRRLAAGLDADQALELTGTGAERERNRLIAAAAALLDGAPTRRAKILAAAIARLPRHRQQGNVLMDTLAAADRCAPLPRSWRQLYSILATADDEVSATRKAS